MARITVEDCLENVDNLFNLVIIASKRARRLANGAQPLVDWENDKPTVVALREIAAGLITKDTVDTLDLPKDDLLGDEAERMLAEAPLGQIQGDFGSRRGRLGTDLGPEPFDD